MFVTVTLGANTASDCLLSGRHRMKRNNQLMTSSHMFWFCHHLHQCSTLMFHSHLASNGTTKLLRSYRLVLFVWVAYSALKGIVQALTQKATAQFLKKHRDRSVCPWCDHSISFRNWTVRTGLDWRPVLVSEKNMKAEQQNEVWTYMSMFHSDASWQHICAWAESGLHQKGVE